MGVSVILSSYAKGWRWLLDYSDFSGNAQNSNSTPSPGPGHSPRSAKRIMELVGVRANLEARTSGRAPQDMWLSFPRARRLGGKPNVRRSYCIARSAQLKSPRKPSALLGAGLANPPAHQSADLW